MKYKLIHFFSRLSNQLRKGKDRKREWNRFNELSKNLNAISETKTNHLLIIRLDDIGDFLLFAPALKNWIEEQNKEVFLLGNKAWKTYFEALFPETKIQCIWLDKKEWFHSFEYRNFIVGELNKIAPQDVIYASYTRVLLLELILKNCLPNAKHSAWEAKIGAFSKQLNSGYQFLKKRIDGFHETANNSSFLSDIGNKKPDEDYYLNFPETARSIKEEYFIICPGGNQKSKQWPAKSFAEIANLTLNKFPLLNCVLVGGPDDDKISSEIKSGITSKNVINITGKTSLIELAEICKNANFAFSNDTSAAHLCALQKTPVYVLVNGNRYGRFFPYPKSFKKVMAVYPDLEKPIYDWEEKMPIASIPSNKIWNSFLAENI